ncbi:hypothetical protein [uncultured Rhodoblastus sp.]|uniref:hypothetical protein n=1 Tax=uncultured Rhodoblastus sp. TaxID=543037 RepID=UPI0025D73144|nr:hypothetical protein [uncultured Rhodoblastus sp.]
MIENYDISALWPGRTRGKRIARLVSSIDAYELVLKSSISFTNYDGLSADKKDLVLLWLSDARDKANRGHVDAGWKLFLALKSEVILFLEENEVEASVIALRSEANHKLSGWRREAVNKLLDLPKTGADVRYNLRAATEILNEHFHNEAYKDNLRKITTAQLVLCMVGALVALYLMLYFCGVDILRTSGPDKFDLDFLIFIAICGFLGATISAVTDFANQKGSFRIPELVASWQVTALRLCMGAVSAVVALFVAAGGIFSVKNSYAMVVVALASGLSEKLVLNLVRSYATEDEPKKP